MAYVITVTDGNGNKICVEVSYEIYRFEKNYYRNEERNIQKSKDDLSCEELFRINEECFMGIPEQLTTAPCEAEVINNFSNEELHKAIDQLPEKQRRRLILRHVHNLTIPEIAEIEKCNKRAIKASLKKSLEFLRKVCAICRCPF